MLIDTAFRYIRGKAVDEVSAYHAAVVEVATILASNLFITGESIKEIFDRAGVTPSDTRFITVATGEVGNHDEDSGVKPANG
jgi:hypothetical protein